MFPGTGVTSLPSFILKVTGCGCMQCSVQLGRQLHIVGTSSFVCAGVQYWHVLYTQLLNIHVYCIRTYRCLVFTWPAGCCVNDAIVSLPTCIQCCIKSFLTTASQRCPANVCSNCLNSSSMPGDEALNSTWRKVNYHISFSNFFWVSDL